MGPLAIGVPLFYKEILMTLAIVSDLRTRNIMGDWANRTYAALSGTLNVKLFCVSKKNDYTGIKAALHLLPKNLIRRVPAAINIGINKDQLGIVDIIWDDFLPPLLNSDNKLSLSHLDGEFVFYTMHESFDEKLINIILEFNKQFDPAEPVNLLIKVPTKIDNEIAILKNSLNLYKDIGVYKKHVVISKSYSELDSILIHNTGNCYIDVGNKLNLAYAIQSEALICPYEQINNMAHYVYDFIDKTEYKQLEPIADYIIRKLYS